MRHTKQEKAYGAVLAHATQLSDSTAAAVQAVRVTAAADDKWVNVRDKNTLHSAL